MELQELEAKYQELGKEIEKLKAEECKYPKFFKCIGSRLIIKFTGLVEGEVVFSAKTKNIGLKSCYKRHTDETVWEEIPYDETTGFYHKQLIWCWNKIDTHERKLRFYDAINKRAFSFLGTQKGSTFDIYEPYDWSHEFINKWAIKAFETLKDK